MEKDLDKLISYAGNKSTYQIILLLFVFSLWISIDLLSISIAYIEQKPIVNYVNKVSGAEVQNVTLTYEICRNSSSITFVRASGNSFISEFHLDCDKSKITLMGCLIFIGLGLGNLAYQFTSNWFGRRMSTLIGALGYSITMCILSFTNSYYYGIVFMTIGAMFSYLSGMSSLTLLYEVISKEISALFNSIVNAGFAICGLVFILLFKYLNSWKIPFGIDSAFNLIIAVGFFFFAEESPRYHLVNGDIDLLLTSLTRIARINGKQEEFQEFVLDSDLSDENGSKPDSITLLSEDLDEDALLVNEKIEIKRILTRLRTIPAQTVSKTSSHTVWHLLKYSSQRTTFFLVSMLFFSCGMVYYGLSINIKDLPGDIYTNGLITYGTEVVAYAVTSFIVDNKYLGRIRTFWIVWGFSTFCYAVILIGNFRDLTLTIISFVARFFISLTFQVSYTYSIEVYPTVVRAPGLGMNALVSKIGALISPFLIEYLQFEASYVFCFFCLTSLICSIFLKETLCLPIQDTIPEEEEKLFQETNLDCKNELNCNYA